MTRLSMDSKVMSKSYKGHTFILVVIDGVTNFMVTISIHQSRSEEVEDVFKEHVFSKISIPECMNIDQDSAFMSTLLTYLFKKLCIKIKKLLLIIINLHRQNMELKSLATILTKHSTGLGQHWQKYLPLAMYSYNTFCSPNLNWFSPYELGFWKKTQSFY